MSFQVHSFILSDGALVNIEDAAKLVIHDADYIEGAIQMEVDGGHVLTCEELDWVDQLWAYLIEAAQGIKRREATEFYFPDQPFRVSFLPRNNGWVTVVVGDRKMSFSQANLIQAIAQGATAFLTIIRAVVPKHAASWDRYLVEAKALL